MQARNRDAEQAHSREVEIHKRYAPAITALKRSRRWIKKYAPSLVGVHADAILQEIDDALRGVGEK